MIEKLMRMLHKCRKILGAIYVRKAPTKFKGQCYPTATHSKYFIVVMLGLLKGQQGKNVGIA